MIPNSPPLTPPLPRRPSGGRPAAIRTRHLPGRVPSIEQILQKQLGGHHGDGADELLAGLKRDNRNLEAMLANLMSIAGTA